MSIQYITEDQIVATMNPTTYNNIEHEGMTWINISTMNSWFGGPSQWDVLTTSSSVTSSNYQMTTPVIVNQNSNHTYTAAEWLSGIIMRNTSSDVEDTLPTASSIIALIPSAVVGLTFTTQIYNISNKEVQKHYDGVGMNTVHLTTTEMKLKKDDVRTFRCVIASISPDNIDVYSPRTDMTG